MDKENALYPMRSCKHVVGASQEFQVGHSHFASMIHDTWSRTGQRQFLSLRKALARQI